MFSRSARIYDAVYAWKDYAGEAERVHELVQARKPGAATLLDVACGTGTHLAELRRRYRCEGLDLDADLLAVAREPHVGAVFVDEPELKIARVNTIEVDGRTSSFDFHYLVGTPERVEHFVEHHELALFTHEEHLGAFHAAGLEVEHDEEGLMGRGLYVGVARS